MTMYAYAYSNPRFASSVIALRPELARPNSGISRDPGNVNGTEMMHPRLFMLHFYLLRAQRITNSQTRQTNRQYEYQGTKTIDISIHKMSEHVLPLASPVPFPKGSDCQVIMGSAVHLPSRRLYTTHQDDESGKKNRRERTVRKDTVAPPVDIKAPSR